MQRDSGEAAADGEEPVARGRGWPGQVVTRGRLLFILAGAAVLGLLLGYLTAVLVIFPAQTSAVELNRVPEAVGLETGEARALIEAAGLAYDEEGGLYHRSPVGTVIAQEPLSGQMAAPGSTVKVTLSLGPKMSPVPDVVGLDHSQAEVALARAGYESELDWVDADADVGQVVDTRPAPGTPLQLPGTVRLFVSAGARRVTIPNLVTLSLSGARETLERLGLRLGDIREDSASLAAPGTVIGQTPSSGTVVDRATRVVVLVATAPELNQPPDTGSSR
ncbi:MAG: PASTA domain-containing protein [Gemmatimonadales bacterium]